MAVEVYHYAETIAAGTLASAPALVSIPTPVRVVTRIAWRFPAGCAGLVGIRFAMSNVPIYPLPAGAWVVDGDGLDGWDLTDAPDSGAWQLQAYNTGAFPHTVRLTLYADLTQPRQLDLDPLARLDALARLGAS